MKEKLYLFLRWSERYTNTDMVYLTTGGFWLTLGHAVAVGFSFLLTIAFANLLPQEAYGTYKYTLSAAGVLTAFSLTGFKTAVVQDVARGFEGTLRQAFWTNLRWGMVTVVASAAALVYYLINGNRELAIAYLIIGLFSPLLGSAGLYSMFLNGKKHFKRSAFYGMLNTFVPTVLIFTALLFTDNPVALVLVYFFSYTAVGLCLYVMTLHVYNPHEITDPSSLRHTKHLSAMNIIGVVALFIDKILVFHYLGAASLAVYAFATMVPDQIRAVFLKNIGGLVLPRFSEKSMTIIQKNIFPKIARAAVILLCVTVFYIISAPSIFSFLFPRYIASVFYSQLFSISLVTTLVCIPVSILQSQHKTKELYQFNVSAGVVQLVLLFALTALYGIIGALVAQIISRFFALGIGLALVRRSKS